MKRTTIMLDEGLLLEAKYLADQQKRTFTSVVREALREYVQTHRPRRNLSFVGIASSKEPFRSAEELDAFLKEGLDPLEGWSPERGEAALERSQRAS